MNLQPLTPGAVSNTGTVELVGAASNSGVIGGVLITADGTNDAVVVLRENNSAGKVLFDITSKSPLFVVAPIRSGETAQIWYTITGTGASAMLYEWID